MLNKKYSRFLCRMLAVTVASASIFATSPMTQAQTVEVVSEASQVAADDQIVLHVKGKEISIHYWGCDEPTTWPGKAAESDSVMGDGWSYLAFPASITGFIIVQNGGNKLTDDVKGKKAGEYWFKDGKFYESNPEGPATPTPVPTPGPLNIDGISPADSTVLKAGEEQTITVGASSTIGDKLVYYKYEVMCGKEYVGDHYYSKNNTYKFTPEDGKEYTVKISVQAHDEKNTTVTKELKYIGSKDGEIATPGPVGTETNPPATPGQSSGIETNQPATPGQSSGTETNPPATPGQSSGTETNPSATPGQSTGTETNPSATPGQSTGTNPSATPGQSAGTVTTAPTTKEPAKTTTPESKTPDETPVPTQSSGTSIGKTNPPSVTNAPIGTTTPSEGGFDDIDDGEFSVKASVSKTRTYKVGSKITLNAAVKNQYGSASMCKYSYIYYKTKTPSGDGITIRKPSKTSKYTWIPKKAGTYYVYVRATDQMNQSSEVKIGKFTIKAMTLSTKVSKKSPAKVKTKITFSASNKDSTGKVQYRFVIKLKNKVVKDSKYKAKNKYEWKPTKKGTYTIYIYAKDSYTTVTKKTTFKIK